jgi:SagB-type dehydrogenase family enzyme
MRLLSLLVVLSLVYIAGCGHLQDEKAPATHIIGEVIKLPDPAHDSNTSIEKALLSRRSVREFKAEPLTLREVSQLLWAAQGITGPAGFRTAPSAGALYPLEIYVAAGSVESLPSGVYRYKPDGHELVRVAAGDKRAELCDAALGQASVKNAPIDIVIAGVHERTTVKYGKQGVKYVYMEAGHAAQNVYLQAVSQRLGTVTIGAIYDDEVKKAMGMRDDERPMYVMPVGRI